MSRNLSSLYENREPITILHMMFETAFVRGSWQLIDFPCLSPKTSTKYPASS